MIRRKFVILPLMAAILMMAAACGNELNPETETPATSAETDPSLEPTRGQATVDNIDVVVLESFPVGVNVIVSGNLPDSCTRIDQAIAQQTGSTFQGVVTTVREPDTAGCTMALSPFETTIPLDVDGLEAGTYIVDVNGVQDSFTLDVDNVAATDPASAEPTPTLAPEPEAEGTTSEIGGLVFHDVCAGTGLPTDELAEGCVTDALGSPVADGTLADNEPPIEGVQINLFAGQCVSVTGSDGLTAITDAAGSYSFTDLPAGDYCIFLDSADDVNADVLEQGTQTAPVINDVVSNSIDVTLAAGESLTDIDFGWDYAFLPAPEVDLTDCTNSIEYIEDLNLPDGSLIPTGEEFTKSWRLRNDGTCPWTTDYALVNVGGDPIPAPESVPFTEIIQPGQTVDVSVTFTAPEVPGTYRSNWQIADPNGDPFGIGGAIEDAFWVQVEVDANATSQIEDDPATAVIGGVVWEDICFLDANGNPGSGCVETTEGSGFYVADGTFNNNETVIPDVTVLLAEGPCPATGDIVPSAIVETAVTDASGIYTFEGLEAGTYCTAIEALDEANVDLLIPGNWTYPFRGAGRIGVLLSLAEERLSIDFGWQYQE